MIKTVPGEVIIKDTNYSRQLVHKGRLKAIELYFEIFIEQQHFSHFLSIHQIICFIRLSN